ncbi:MAG: hypothetical protein FRX48_00554 [Lasallia pustulata]|uniref:MADS-box domain-containing protein n=1 Tax=Lasallia pustulata TaxID=136370 RepID=A0A5M8Q104_9LECA|nr:MAG: hypothetical protein FRX48_00554 [Lasallia pustulata]
MGRRKIEIKAIKDDRNRAVTFLKRKGGLFKKAHELSVLCSVDVAVIIFGHNKKLYEFSSGNINDIIGRYHYYGVAHEHKGPADFNGKGGMDDDDDDDMGTPPVEDQPLQEPNMSSVPPHLQNQSNYQHMRHAPSASPPMTNGVPFHHRQHTPQPQVGSRPSSRNNGRRPSSLVSQPPQHPQQVTQAPPAQNGFAYMPNPPLYNPQAAHGMPVAPHHGQPRPQPRYQYSQPQPQPPQHALVQQAYMQEHRGRSMPPAFPQQEGLQQQQKQQQQQQYQQATSSTPQPEAEQRSQDLQPQQPKPMPAQRGIFTPIDENQSMLAQHWVMGTTNEPRSDAIKQEKDNRSQSVDVGTVQRQNASSPHLPPPRPQRGDRQAQRSGEIQPPSRTSSAQLGANRPKLNLQIPSEQSDGGSATAESSPRGSGGTAGDTPAKASTDASHSSGVVLPPPSPSASAILSAGAQGPTNPFARPHLPLTSTAQNTQAYGGASSNNIETPISALPSRFVADGLLPSPSAFYPEWGFGRGGGDSNMLPSPLNFQTPVMGNGPSFLRDEEGERKRKSPDGGEGQGGEGGGLKRLKI